MFFVSFIEIAQALHEIWWWQDLSGRTNGQTW